LLEIVEGPDAGRQVPVGGALEIGRDPAADVVLSDQVVSRHHARVQLDQDGAYVVDLDSRNGTFVNGTQIHNSARVQPGDQLMVGATVLQVRTPSEVATQPTAVRPVPPALAAAARTPDYVPAAILKDDAGVRQLESLLDVKTKNKARTAPIAIFVLVVFVVLIFLALRHQ
jgi:pSer/pThr/pTyr-binding forkhead associated (FHA) protein